MTKEEQDYAFINGPFNEQGWYEILPNVWTPGLPFVKEMQQYYKDNPNYLKEVKEEFRKIMEE